MALLHFIQGVVWLVNFEIVLEDLTSLDRWKYLIFLFRCALSMAENPSTLFQKWANFTSTWISWLEVVSLAESTIVKFLSQWSPFHIILLCKIIITLQVTFSFTKQIALKILCKEFHVECRKKPGSQLFIIILSRRTDEWSAVKRNPSYAVALALRYVTTISPLVQRLIS